MTPALASQEAAGANPKGLGQGEFLRFVRSYGLLTEDRFYLESCYGR